MEDKVKGKLAKAMWQDLFEKMDELHDEVKSKLNKNKMEPVYIGSSGEYPNKEVSEK